MTDTQVGCILVAIGFASTAGAFFIYRKRSGLRMTYQTTEGMVISMVKGLSRNSGHAPVVAYEVNGAKFSYRSKMYTRPAAFRQGETVTVFYNPDKPEEAMLSGFVEQWLVVVILGALGMAFVLGGIKIIQIN